MHTLLLLMTMALGGNNVCCKLDVDRSGQSRPLVDGVIISRYINGIRGPALLTAAQDPAATRTKPKNIVKNLDACQPMLNVDGNGVVDQHDGDIIIAYLFQLDDATLASKAGAGCTRCAGSDLRLFLNAHLQGSPVAP